MTATTRTISKTTYNAILKIAKFHDDGSVNVESTMSLLELALRIGPTPEAGNEDFESVTQAVEACFAEAGTGKAVQRKVLLDAALASSPLHGERILKDLLSTEDYVGRQKVGFYKASEAPAVKPKAMPKAPPTVDELRAQLAAAEAAATVQASAPEAEQTTEA